MKGGSGSKKGGGGKGLRLQNAKRRLKNFTTSQVGEGIWGGGGERFKQKRTVYFLDVREKGGRGKGGGPPHQKPNANDVRSKFRKRVLHGGGKPQTMR